MDPSNKNILLISYVFPPYYGIGGRRWAKQADALTKLGYTVHVIHAKNPFKKQSLWNEMVDRNSNIIRYALPAHFPKVLVESKHNFFQKLKYKFWILVLPLFTKGSYLDRSIWWKNTMLREATKIIDTHHIKNIICTGGPFGVMYHATLLKKKYNDILLVNDLRDPWTWGPNWGFSKLSAKRMQHELRLEKAMIENSDVVTVPTLELKLQLDKKYPESKDKIKTLFHFYDKHEMTVEKKSESSKIRLVLYGNIYNHITDLIEETAKTIANYKDHMTLDIYTDVSRYKTVFEKHNASNVTFHEQLPAKELFKLFKNYDYVYFMLPDVGVNHISTKFYEVIYSKTPFFIFCKYGLAAEFVMQNKLGIHAELNGLAQVFDRLMVDKNFKNYNKDFDLSPYALENNALQIESMFNR